MGSGDDFLRGNVVEIYLYGGRIYVRFVGLIVKQNGLRRVNGKWGMEIK